MTLDDAWAESTRLWAEGDRFWAESTRRWENTVAEHGYSGEWIRCFGRFVRRDFRLSDGRYFVADALADLREIQ